MSRYITDEDAAQFSALDSDEDENTTTGDDQPDEPDEGDEGEVGDEEPDGEEAAEASDDDTEGKEEEPTVDLLIGGQSLSLTHQQIAEGFMRQADYTRKTQQLAAERNSLADAQAIAEALDRNPALAVRTIARHYGVQVGDDEDYEEPQGPTPQDLALQELYAWRQQQEAAQQRQAIYT